jgi:hypothetical protein
VQIMVSIGKLWSNWRAREKLDGKPDEKLKLGLIRPDETRAWLRAAPLKGRPSTISFLQRLGIRILHSLMRPERGCVPRRTHIEGFKPM